MAGFKDDGLYLQNITGSATLPLSGHVLLYAHEDGTINAKDSSGNVLRLDNVSLESLVTTISSSYTKLTTTAAISAFLLSSINAETAARIAADAVLQAEIDSLTISAGNSIIKGVVNCNTIDLTYTIIHSTVLNNHPLASLEIPSDSDAIFVQGIHNVSPSGFQVTLSDIPTVTGYKINWLSTIDNAAIVAFTEDGEAGTFTKVITNAAGQVISGSDVSLPDLTDVYKLTGSTTNNTETEIFIDGILNSRMVMPSNKLWTFIAYISAKRTDGPAEIGGYKLEGIIDNNSGTVSLFGFPLKTIFGETNNAWDANAYEDVGNGALIIKVTGETGKNINWTAIVQIIEA